ncbi:MAG: MBL fold metallo-hydrolase, partial [Syntrophobacteraceae bacterium]
MQITCLGAAHCVTGSCFLLDNGHKYLIDCGMFQGGRQMEALNYAEWGFNPREITAIFLTHAHIDHCGRIPKLFKDGF